MLNALLYVIARTLVFGIQCLPLKCVALLGRCFGWLAWRLDRRHRNVALKNIADCFPEKSTSEVRSIARENFKRIGENFTASVKTASMSEKALLKVLTVKYPERIKPNEGNRWIMAVSHFGNFELYARASMFLDNCRITTTYRGLRQPAIDKLLLHLRRQTGALYFERRTEGDKLKEALRRGTIMLGLLADQHAGDRGAWLPLFGRECSTSTAPGVFALRYECPLHSAFCHRVGLGRWCIEMGEEIPTTENGKPRPIDEISTDVNLAYEAAIRRDPANWFWVHRRWKPASKIQLARLAAKKSPSENEAPSSS